MKCARAGDATSAAAAPSPSAKPVHRDILFLLAGQQSVYARFIYHRAMAAVTVRDLVVRYDATTVLDRVSVSVASGELLMLLGPSGCGKTTLLRSIAGFVEPSAGAILFDDEDVTSGPPTRATSGWSSRASRCGRT